MIVYNNKYTVDGFEYKSLAEAEQKARSLLGDGQIQVLIKKNKEPYEVFFIKKSGEVTACKIKGGIV